MRSSAAAFITAAAKVVSTILTVASAVLTAVDTAFTQFFRAGESALAGARGAVTAFLTFLRTVVESAKAAVERLEHDLTGAL